MPDREHVEGLRYGSLAAAISALGRADFPSALVDFIASTASADSALVLVYWSARRPDILLNRMTEVDRQDRENRYVGGAYLLDPFYNYAMSIDGPAVVALGEIAPPDFLSSQYVTTYYRTNRIADEVNILVPIRSDFVIAICVERHRGAAVYSPQDLSQLRSVLPLIAALVRKHVELDRSLSTRSGTGADSDHERFKSRLDAFGRNSLTAREREIVQLMLAGYDAKSLARRLDVSYETVRVHRRNIYRKLGVSSLGGLFKLALSALEGDSAAIQPPTGSEHD